FWRQGWLRQRRSFAASARARALERQAADCGYLQSQNQTTRSGETVGQRISGCRQTRPGRWREAFVLRTGRAGCGGQQALRRRYEQSRDSRRRSKDERNQDTSNQGTATAGDESSSEHGRFAKLRRN